jgi:MFS family permease
MTTGGTQTTPGAGTEAESTSGISWPSPRQAWTAMGVLALVRMSAQLDLTILSLLVEPIKKDMGLSDGQIGLLLGLAFAVFYLGLGVPLSKLVDSYSRKTILAVGVAFWSLSTAMSGLASNFVQLFFCRAAVGAGESVNGPATFSMIADMFPRERLARAIAVLNMGSVAGTAVAMIFSAFVIHWLETIEMPSFPIIGTPRPWQAVFFIIGLPGLFFALMMYALPEPRRQGGPVKAESFGGILRFMKANWRLFAPLFVALLVSGIESGGAGMWRPAFLTRTYGWSPAQVALVSGIVSLVTGVAGVFLGSFLSEYLAKKHDNANLRVVLTGWIIATPCMVAYPLVDNPWVSVTISGIASLAALMGAPTQNAALQSVVPGHMRGQITALYLLTFTLAGSGIGPSFIAAITEYVVGDEAGLRYALSGSAAVMMPLAIIIMICGLKPYAARIAQLKAEEARG